MSDDVIDMRALSRLLHMIGGDADDFRDVLDAYLDGAEDLVAQMRAGAASGDRDVMRIGAHTLKSNARDVGAMRLCDRCADLENACRGGDLPPNPAAQVEAIAAEEAAARAALNSVDVHGLRHL